MRKVSVKSIKYIAFFSALVVAAVYVFNYQMLGYGIGQLKGQLNLLMRRSPIEKSIENGEFSKNQILKLQLIDSVLVFAQQNLGFRPTNNYTYWVNLEGKPAMWVMSASPKFSMQAYQWQYPILGGMAYKGFFDSLVMADEKFELKQKQYDVCVGRVEAWSTLGFLPDPVLSSMLTLPKIKLVRLILHELTHAEIFIARDGDLNENVATFVGNEGAKLFFNVMYGQPNKYSKQLTAYLNDLEKISNYTLSFKNNLEAFYQEIYSISAEEKQRLKREKMVQFKVGLKQLKLENSENFNRLMADTTLPKNCFFNEVSMYNKHQDVFYEILQTKYNGDLKFWVDFYKEKYGNSINVFR